MIESKRKGNRQNEMIRAAFSVVSVLISFSMCQISTLLIGDLDRPEFQGVVEFLGTFGKVHRFLDVATAAGVLASGEIVADLTVIVQLYPGEFSQTAIDRLRAASPLSRIIALLGTWCEGEMRSGQPWPAVVRRYWHQGWGAIGEEIRRLARGDCPHWGLPLTATEEERLLAETAPRRTDCESASENRQVGNLPHVNPPRKGLIGIAARRYESFDWLAAACRHQGYAALWLRGPSYLLLEGFSSIFVEGTDFR
jgi:hypothetical protein